jgi:hypothetical protein
VDIMGGMIKPRMIAVVSVAVAVRAARQQAILGGMVVVGQPS